MSGKWKKVIWALLMIQLCLLHVFFLKKIEFRALNYWYRGCVRLGLPFSLYNAGFALAVSGMSFISAVMALVFFIRYRRFRVRCIRNLYPVEEEALRQKYKKACSRAGIERESRKVIYKSADTATPFVLGFYRPMLLLPEWVDGGEMSDLLLFHECVHIRHKDTWYKLFLFLCNAVCWYNPLAYLIRSVSARDVEIDCDETVVTGCGNKERAAYGQFLIDSLQRIQGKEYVCSAFFGASGRMMKARIAAIMEEKRPYDAVAKIAAAALLLETVLFAGIAGKNMIEARKAQEKPQNIYEGYEKPECFTDRALADMLALAPASRNTYRMEVQSLPEDGEDLGGEAVAAEGPWMVNLKNNRHYGDCVKQLLYRYLYYDRDQIAASQALMDEDASGIPLGVIYQRLLAGGREEAVFAVIFREIRWDSKALNEDMERFARLEKVDGSDYAYYSLAVHVKMAGDSVFELQGLTEMEETVQAFRERYPENDYSDVPRFVGKPKFETETEYEVRTGEGILEMRERGTEEWETVPVTLEELFRRGDGMDGVLTGLQEGSYQCDRVKQIFAYGGATGYGGEASMPVCVVYCDREAGAFRNSVVTKDYGSVRRLFVSFPEDEKKGYLVLTSDRTMWQESTTLFVTEDGGKNWRECKAEEGGELMLHSLTTDMKFITNEVGFITIRDSETPDVIRTGDGGVTWKRVNIDAPAAYYSMAYAPFFEDGKLAMDAGEEEYSKNGGVKARYVSEDLGETWQFEGFVLRQ